jgi:hypothetical protein
VYQSRNFNRAAELYTLAIAISPKDDAVYYSNRAACAIFLSLSLFLFFFEPLEPNEKQVT